MSALLFAMLGLAYYSLQHHDAMTLLFVPVYVHCQEFFFRSLLSERLFAELPVSLCETEPLVLPSVYKTLVSCICLCETEALVLPSMYELLVWYLSM